MGPNSKNASYKLGVRFLTKYSMCMLFINMYILVMKLVWSRDSVI
jgi:hypothetical protein